MTAKALTTTAVSSAKPKSKPYKLSDLDRLYVLVSTAGSKTWKWGYRLDDKDCTYTLGKFPAMGVADARARRAELQKIVDTGAHPRDADERARAAVQAEQANTLWAVVEEWLALKKPGWSPVYAGQIETLLTRYVQPALGHMPVREITAKHVYNMIRAIAVRKTRAEVERKDTAPHAAAITRRTLDGVFRFAIMTDRADVNPVTALRAADVITAPPTRNNRALSPDELRALLLAIDAYTGRELTRIALTLLLLLFVRTGELRGARWSEFDFENAMWSIPAARTKMRRPHLVPLAPLVLSVLRRLREITGG
jgi:integrase